MFKKALSNPLLRFLLLAFSLYFIWYFLYELYLSPYTGIDRWMDITLVDHSKALLELFGYTAYKNDVTSEVTLMLEGSVGNGVWVGHACNGMTLFSLFAIFVIAYPGPILKKLWFIPLGILIIHFINMLRVAALAVIERDAPETLAFNHTYTFTIVVYSIIFLLWYWWVSRLSKFNLREA